MDAHLRPDLTRILPRPVTRPRGGLRFDDTLSVSKDDSNRTDYLVDVERATRPQADDTGFTVHQAQAAAERLAQTFGQAQLRPGLHALDAGRAQRLLS